MPINRNVFTLSPKPMAQMHKPLKAKYNYDLSTNQSLKNERIFGNESQTKFKFYDFNSSEFKRIAEKRGINEIQNTVNKIESEVKYGLTSIVPKTLKPSETCVYYESNQKTLSTKSVEENITVSHKTMQTLAKFHKTSSEKLLIEPKISHKKTMTKV
jgi:hypothetical protein